MTYEAAIKLYSICIEAGQSRSTISKEFQEMGLTQTQMWAVVNRRPDYFTRTA